MKRFALLSASLLALLLASGPSAAGQTNSVPRFGVLQVSFTHSGKVANPYRDISATATFNRPGGGTRTVPLFWDGGTTWRVRFSPDREGTWTWSVRSNNPGLDGASGSFRCESSTYKGGVRARAGAPHHFERQDGTPFWWMGDTHWILFSDDAKEGLDRSSVLEYVDVRARQGFNVVHSALYVSRGNNGGRQFFDVRAEALNPGFWREVDVRVGYLRQKGITAGLVLAWGTMWPDFPSEAARLRYARYVVARYSAFNVYFVVANEWSDGLTASQARAIGREIAARDPHERLIGNHDIGSVERFADEGWMSFGDYQQIYSDLHGSVLAARDHGKPVVNAEYAYFLRDMDGDGLVDKSNSFSLEDIRRATWDVAMAGGYFVTGFGTTYYGGYRDPGPFNVHSAKNDDWEEDVQLVRKLFTRTSRLAWWALQPADWLLTCSVGRDGDAVVTNRDGSFVRPPKRTYWALAQIGRQYVAYVRGYDGPHTLSLGGASSASYSVRRFNPRTGSSTLLGTYSGRGPVTLNPPDSADWVYVLVKE